MKSALRLASRFLSRAQEVGLVNASFSGGQMKAGVEFGPDAILKAGLAERLQEQGYSIFGLESLPRYDEWKNQNMSQHQSSTYASSAALVSAVTQCLSQCTYAQALLRRPVLSIGGDHSVAIGTVSGVAKAMHDEHGKDLAVFWIDAHADLNTPETSSSGNIHGMPLAFLTGVAGASKQDQGEHDDSVFHWMLPDHFIPTSKLVYIGLRDVDDSELQLIKQKNIRAYTASDVRAKGIITVMNEALEYIGNELPIFLGFDIDSLDPSIAPSTGLPVVGGLTMNDGLHIVTRICETRQLVAMDLVECNPQVDPDGDGGQRTAQAAVDIITTVFRHI